MSYTEINSVKVYKYHAFRYNHEINCDDYKRFRSAAHAAAGIGRRR